MPRKVIFTSTHPEIQPNPMSFTYSTTELHPSEDGFDQRYKSQKRVGRATERWLNKFLIPNIALTAMFIMTETQEGEWEGVHNVISNT